MSFISHTNLLIQTMKCVHKKWFSMIHVKRDLKRFGNVFFFIVVVVSFRANKRSLSKRSVGNYKCVCYLIFSKSFNNVCFVVAYYEIGENPKIYCHIWFQNRHSTQNQTQSTHRRTLFFFINELMLISTVIY